MNQKLQNIFDLIQQSEKLDAEQKENLLKAVKDADKELEITAFKLERTEKVKKTTAILLEETIEELEQKRKAVEEQNRELEIEASLERVRTVAMSMNKSEDLLNICEASFKEFKKLGFDDIRNALIHIQYDEQKYFMDYDYSDLTGGAITKIEYGSHPVVEDYLEQINSAKDAFYQGVIKEDQLEEWKNFRRNSGQIEDPRLEKATTLYYYFFSIGIGDIGISTLQPIDESQIKILKRFRNVFDLAYRRYTDIAQAETQAREAEIELALERVRARTMAMQSSNELKDVVENLFDGLKSLGVDPTVCNISLMDEKTCDSDVWSAHQTDNGLKTYRVFISHFEHPFRNKLVDAFLNKSPFSVHELSGDLKKTYMQHLIENVDYSEVPDEITKSNKKLVNKEESIVLSAAYMKYGLLIVSRNLAISKDESDILQRFTKIFEQTYTRFLDLQKAEGQAREAQIQLSLERVRARSMAMHSSEELNDVLSILFQQFDVLGIKPINVWLSLLDEQKGTFTYRSTGTSGSRTFTQQVISFNAMDIWQDVLDQWKSGTVDPVSVTRYPAERLPEVFEVFKETFMAMPEKERINVKDFPNGFYNIQGYCKFGYIGYNHVSPPTEEEKNLVSKFATEFERVYQRFLDIEKAEAQAREAQIQLALERIRARTMAMHKSEEIKDVVVTVMDRMNDLNIEMNGGVSLATFVPDSNDLIHWYVNPAHVDGPVTMHLPYFDNILFHDFIEARKSGKEILPVVYSFEQKNEYFEYTFEHSEFKIIQDDLKKWILEQPYFGYSVAIQKHSAIFFNDYTGKLFSKDENEILIRFAKVFDQAYIRFLDLKKAEAQAREAQIEAALERVRSRSMGMQKSDELREVISLVYEQFVHLKINLDHAGFVVDYSPKGDWHFWIADKQEIPSKITHPYYDSVWANQFNDAKEKGTDFFATNLNFEEKNKFYKELLSYVPGLPDKSKEFYFNCPGLAVSTVLLDNVGLYIENFSGTPYSDEDNKILMRFGKVFQQTYTRFLDLQKVEAQARESQIQLALEKVRMVALGLNKSEEMLKVAKALYEQLLDLGFLNIRNAIIDINNEDGDTFTDYDYSHEMSGTITQMSYHDDPTLEGQFKKMATTTDDFFELVLEGKELQDLVNMRLKNGEAHDPRLLNIELLTYNLFSFGNGAIGISNFGLLNAEEKSILDRFRNVFTFAYKRYNDLAAAEAQAREVIKQASLDRIRGEIASMRTAEDLNRITPIIWRELKTLEVPFIRCGVFIVDEANEKVQVYLTTPDGKSLGVLNLSFDENKLTANTVDYWKKKQVYKEHWDKQKFINWTKSLMKIGQVQNAETYQGSSNPPESLDLHFVPFTQGMLYVGDVSPLTDEKLDLVKTLAEAFSIAYARYEDFKNLEEAKNKIEFTLHELKAAQAQLVHSEKMASLGELTAGIAHEIKNPLNFVNNFSEISSELINEIEEELEKNDKQEVLEILKDLKQNLNKINQHGKRADSIVKGMLLHSRGSSGEKTLTDINDLLDQYVNLAYHGMRAQNKEFNITIEKDYDKSLEKINVVPQDISRVFLNIINNACYAAYDKKKTSTDNNFSPTLKVSTKNLNGKVEIRIADNGNGIPKDILDKIFQPFFTTKPTGEGTGLGLSLSYDVVTKVHNGNITFASEDGNFTEFVITLPKP